MTLEQMRIAIGKHTGIQIHTRGVVRGGWLEKSIQDAKIPNYPKDLNEVAKIINGLSLVDRLTLLHHLDLITLERSKEWFPARIITVTPAEYCLALCRLWGLEEPK